MKLYNRELEKFSQFLLDELNLVGKQSRMRMKFLKLIVAEQDELREFHIQLLKEHSNLDEEGNPKIIDRDGQQQFDVHDIQSFNKAYTELLNEEVVIEENEANKEMLLSVRESIENCPNPFKGEKAIIHDRLCDLFENIYSQ